MDLHLVSRFGTFVRMRRFWRPLSLAQASGMTTGVIGLGNPVENYGKPMTNAAKPTMRIIQTLFLGRGFGMVRFEWRG